MAAPGAGEQRIVERRPLPPAETGLRSRLADVLEQAQLVMAALPDIDRIADPTPLARAACLLDTANDLLREALQVNDQLRSLDGLSSASALASGGVTVALSALADALCLVQARLDGHLAA